MHDPTSRFAELVQGPESLVSLDRASLLIAAHAYPNLDVDAEVAALDDLATHCPEPTLEGWRRYLFEELRFTGNVEQYYDPANSFLNEVRRRRIGLPISLSVLGMEVGRRLGLGLVGVGMPGHFLIQHVDADPPVWVDPFAGGRVLDRAACEERFHVVNGASTPFLESYLDPVGPRAILARMLANLKAIYATRGNLEALAWVFALRLAIPGIPPLERRDLARVLGSTGQFVDAAEALEELAETLPSQAPSLISEAVALRARLN
ncbi:MAG: transglutaminase-like domain-containing protein [Actinobacteria bacterium]|nr:transglutaminase-like domain-containing protein [Actinomycetota bacterium]